MFNKLRYVSLVFYSFILLMGQMIGIPFIIWLLFTIFDFGNSDQIFAIIGLIGFFFFFFKPNTKSTKKEVIFYLISFLFLLIPLIKRILSIPIETYNYFAFIIPIICFMILQIIALIIKIRCLQKNYS